MDNFTIEILTDGDDDDLQTFDCGEPSLNRFLQESLRRQHQNKILRAYILRSKTADRRVLGYYTLSGSCFERAIWPSESRQKCVPYENFPSVTLGRLTIDRSLQGQGIGAMLVAHALRVVWQASQAVGIHGVFVEALNEKAHAFYLSLGFIPLTGENRQALFYPTQSIERLFTPDN